MVQACNEMGCKRDLRDWGTLDGGSQTSSLFSMTDLEVSLTLFPVWSFYLVGWSWERQARSIQPTRPSRPRLVKVLN